MMVHMEVVQLLSDLGYPKIPEIPIWSWCQIELKNTIHVGKENEILALESRFPEKPWPFGMCGSHQDIRHFSRF